MHRYYDLFHASRILLKVREVKELSGSAMEGTRPQSRHLHIGIARPGASLAKSRIRWVYCNAGIHTRHSRQL